MIVLSVTQVDKEHPGNQITGGQPYFAAAEKGDPGNVAYRQESATPLEKGRIQQRQPQEEGYEENKTNYKKGQFLRIGVEWSNKEDGLSVIGATWFGGLGTRGAKKAH